jgi:hypothetical protein
LDLETLMLSIFVSWRSTWPKNAYIKTPLMTHKYRGSQQSSWKVKNQIYWFDTVDGFCVARTRGTMRRTQRFECRGLYVGDLGSQQNTVMEASSRRTRNALQRGMPSFTQV